MGHSGMEGADINTFGQTTFYDSVAFEVSVGVERKIVSDEQDNLTGDRVVETDTRIILPGGSLTVPNNEDEICGTVEEVERQKEEFTTKDPEQVLREFPLEVSSDARRITLRRLENANQRRLQNRSIAGAAGGVVFGMGAVGTVSYLIEGYSEWTGFSLAATVAGLAAMIGAHQIDVTGFNPTQSVRLANYAQAHTAARLLELAKDAVRRKESEPDEVPSLDAQFADAVDVEAADDDSSDARGDQSS